MFGQPISVDWENQSLDVVTQTVMKKYCSLIHGQPVLEAVLDLKMRNGFTAADVENVRCDVFEGPSTSQAGATSVRRTIHRSKSRAITT
jgi:2-methylcitrate dehydratase